MFTSVSLNKDISSASLHTQATKKKQTRTKNNKSVFVDHPIQDPTLDFNMSRSPSGILSNDTSG